MKDLQPTSMQPMVQSLMRVRRIVTSATYLPQKGEVNNSPSMTVPDQTLSLRNLMLNHTRGHQLPIAPPAIYDEENFVPNPKTLDLVDLEERRYALEDKALELQDTIRMEQQEKNRKLAEEIAEGKKALQEKRDAEYGITRKEPEKK